SQAIRALEDLGYFCVDNLPTTLIPTLAKLSLRAGGDIEKVAIVVDVREGGFLSSFPKIFRKLRKMPRLTPILIFLEASHAALVRRETGRDRAASEFMEPDPAAREFMDRLEEYLRYVVPFYIAEGKSYLTVGIGCTGGRHRSVMIAERLRRPLAGLDVARVRVRHRDLAHA